MKYPENITEVANLQPDYLGFIFYEKSPRNFDGKIPVIDANIKKVGVFVNSSVQNIVSMVQNFGLNAVQLHGEESVDYCQQLVLQDLDIEIFKVFGIKDTFDFSQLTVYEPFVDYFLFDTKGKEKGGNGYVFDWSVLKDYTSTKPFILSGGIGLLEIDAVKNILKTDLPIVCLDINSKFEIAPGHKNVTMLQEFFKEIKR